MSDSTDRTAPIVTTGLGAARGRLLPGRPLLREPLLLLLLLGHVLLLGGQPPARCRGCHGREQLRHSNCVDGRRHRLQQRAAAALAAAAAVDAADALEGPHAVCGRRQEAATDGAPRGARHGRLSAAVDEALP